MASASAKAKPKRTSAKASQKKKKSEQSKPEKFKLGGSAADRLVVAQQDEITALKRALKEAHREEISADAIKQIIGKISHAAEEPPKWVIDPVIQKTGAMEVPVGIWSDWHGGETVSLSETKGINEFNLAIMERRVRRLVEKTIDLCKNHGPGCYPGIVICLLGDFVSGGLHPELLKTDDEEVIPSALRVRDILVWAIDQIAAEFGRVYLPCAAGNHGRNTLKPEFKRYVFKSFDWLIYQLLARHFAGRKDIVFDIPDSNEVLFRVYGHRYLALHGDMLGVKGGDGIIGSIGPIMRGETKVGKQSAAMGRDYDTLLMGHWHQQFWLPRVIVANSLKGFCEFTAKALRASPSIPSQPLWFVHPKWGQTAHRDIKLEDVGMPAIKNWTSWPE